MPSLRRLWDAWFLDERPSVGLSLFRVALAATVGLHVLPTLFQLRDDYLTTAFRELNGSFFPAWALRWADSAPDWFVWTMALCFVVSWASFLVGLLTRWSGVAMDIACYFFYARNSLHIGTLSYDILLVTVFLCLCAPYPGDSFSIDSLIRADPEPWKRRRPFFQQRLLQLQLVFTFFYTGLCKWTAGGNWVTDNAYFYLMRSPPMGVVKEFPGRAFLAARPWLCYDVGLAVIAFEMTLGIWLFWKATRPYAIAAGFLFHLLLLATLHVPTIFFFLFPPMFLLFVDPEALTRWIDSRRRRRHSLGRDRLLTDGGCGLCRAAMRRLLILDLTGRLEPVDYRAVDVTAVHSRLTPAACHARMHLVEPDGRLSAGFDCYRRLTLRLPLLWPLAPWVFLPGMRLIGEPVYDWVAANRGRFHRFHSCRENRCG